MKTCFTCGKSGSPEHFFDPRRRNLCRDCRNRQKREARERYVAFRKFAPPEKACSKCGEVKPIEEYIRRAEARDGRDQRCKACVNQVRRRYWEKNRDKLNAYQRDLKYGLERGDYERMAKEQGGVCAVCCREEFLVVDHCHETGRVRGLLCAQCNKGIGHLEDDAERLHLAARYLERASG